MRISNAKQTGVVASKDGRGYTIALLTKLVKMSWLLDRPRLVTEGKVGALIFKAIVS